MKTDTNFRLQTVLNVREHQEKHLQHELIQIGRQYEQENFILSKLNEEIELAQFEDSTIIRARATEFQTSKEFIDVLSNKKDSQTQKIADIQVKEDLTRDKLVMKRQSKHMLEILKKNHVDKIRKEEDDQFQKLIDDFGTRERRRIGE